MKQIWNPIRCMAILAALAAPAVMIAQEGKNKEKKDVEQVIITRKGDKKEKVVVEIDGDKVTVNGKPIDEYKDNDGNIIVKKNRYINDYDALISLNKVPGRTWSIGDGNEFRYFFADSNRAVLGVQTESAEKGVRIKEVNKESAAEKSGLREGDIIIRVDDTKIEESDGLSRVIRNHKPGDKVTIAYLRDNKEHKTTAELKKLEMKHTFAYAPHNLDFNVEIPRISEFDLRAPFSLAWGTGTPKLGLSVQDTDDGKGVKVIGIDDDSNAAKAGLKEDDVITEVDGKAVNSTDEMVKLIRESRSKTAVMMKLQRGGKTQNIEVKMPRKIKSADL